MKKVVVFVVFVISVWVLTSYFVNAENNDEVIVGIGETEKIILTQAEKIPCYENTERNTGKFEPENECLKGAYILSDNYVDKDIEKFERVTGINHGFYMYTMKADGEFPDEWVISCMAQGKMPFIVIAPPEKDKFNLTNISDISKKLGKYGVSSFVGIYPQPSQVTENPEEFKKFFEGCRRFFELNSENTALVWLCGENPQEDMPYFSDCADWVGMYFYEKVQKDEINTAKERLDVFYNEYAKKLPVMVLYGVSHYSKDNCRYYVMDAQNEIVDFYSSLKEKYPCIKAVCYMDFEGKKSSDNFLLTDTDGMLVSYKSVLNDDYFIEKAENRGGKTMISVKQNYNLMKYKEKIYMPLKYCLEKYDNCDIIFINGEKYVPIGK